MSQTGHYYTFYGCKFSDDKFEDLDELEKLCEDNQIDCVYVENNDEECVFIGYTLAYFRDYWEVDEGNSCQVCEMPSFGKCVNLIKFINNSELFDLELDEDGFKIDEDDVKLYAFIDIC